MEDERKSNRSAEFEGNPFEDLLEMDKYKPMELGFDYTAKDIPGILTKIMFINILLLITMCCIGRCTSPILAKKTIFIPIIAAMFGFYVVFIMDAQKAFLAMEKLCPTREFYECD